MIPNLGGMDPKSIARLMKQMGVQSEEISAQRVIIEQGDSKIVIKNPSVVKITVQGQSSFQISGEISVESLVSEEDVKMVMEAAQSDENSARLALKQCGGDIAEAILKLQEKKEQKS